MMKGGFEPEQSDFALAAKVILAPAPTAPEY